MLAEIKSFKIIFTISLDGKDVLNLPQSKNDNLRASKQRKKIQRINTGVAKYVLDSHKTLAKKKLVSL